MRFFLNCFSLIWAQNLDAQTGILVKKTLWTPSLIFLICASTVSIKSTQYDIIRKFYKLEQSAICRLHLLITASFSFKFCQNHISTLLAGDIQLLCYHKMTKIWTPLPLLHIYLNLVTPNLPRTFTNFHQLPTHQPLTKIVNCMVL